MSYIPVSVYSSLFGDIKKFDYCEAIKNWSFYSDEIVIATFQEEKEDLKNRLKYIFPNLNLKVVGVDTSTQDELWDGNLKNGALQACSNEYVFQQDMDERIGGSKDSFQQIFNFLNDEIDLSGEPLSLMIQCLDLFQSVENCKHPLGAKWYAHSKSGTKRGPVNFSYRDDGSVDPNISDTCELIDLNGDLIKCVGHVNFNNDFNVTHVVHLGLLGLKRKASLNKDFWKEIWDKRHKKDSGIGITEDDFKKETSLIETGKTEKWWKT